jgi:C-terminal processing protease CtpA/Prc
MDEMYGVGIILEQMQQGTGIIVEKVFEGGPAHKSGVLMEGDEIIAVDGSPVDGRSPSELKGHVVGPVGSCVSLRVRKPSGKVLEVSLTRGPAKPEHTALLQRMPQLLPVSR